jgi:hypothetical protein
MLCISSVNQTRSFETPADFGSRRGAAVADRAESAIMDAERPATGKARKQHVDRRGHSRGGVRPSIKQTAAAGTAPPVRNTLQIISDKEEK